MQYIAQNKICSGAKWERCRKTCNLLFRDKSCLMNLLFRDKSRLMNLLFRDKSCLMNLLFRDKWHIIPINGYYTVYLIIKEIRIC